MIVVSAETERGGHKINEFRKNNGLGILDIHVVDLVSDGNSTDEEEKKISSSNQRMRLLGTRIKNPAVSVLRNFILKVLDSFRV